MLCGKFLPGSEDHTSHTSSEMRHMLARSLTASACLGEVGPGESESSIGRPLLSIACRIIRISSCLYGWSEMQSTFSRSTPQAAYCFSSELYQACPAALSLMPQLVGSQGHASVWSAASWARNLPGASMGRLRST